jgi:hypothetical protein
MHFLIGKCYVFVFLLVMLGISQRLLFVPLINTVLLLGAPMLPTWWVKISTYLQSERYLHSYFIIIYLKLLIIFGQNSNILVLCSYQLLRSLRISLHLYFYLFTFFVFICFLSPVLACNLSLVFMLCLSLMWLPVSTLCCSAIGLTAVDLTHK